MCASNAIRNNAETGPVLLGQASADLAHSRSSINVCAMKDILHNGSPGRAPAFPSTPFASASARSPHPTPPEERP